VREINGPSVWCPPQQKEKKPKHKKHKTQKRKNRKKRTLGCSHQGIYVLGQIHDRVVQRVGDIRRFHVPLLGLGPGVNK
jgi:hypothetical protein